MSSFGLGIVLNFVDNASSGMNNATNTFLNMSNTIRGASNSTNTAIQQVAQGTVLNTLGTALTNFGNSMVGVVGNVLGNVQQVGSDFQLFNVTLQQIYGSAEAAEEQIQKLMDFSVKSPFEVADTKDLLVTLKSQGIEAFDSIKGSITGAEQQTLQWLSDLMSFKPEVPMQRWKLAFQNYIGSGEQKMLRNLLDMGKIDEIIGHDISDTVEGRMNDLVEIVEKKNLTGLTDAMFGTMQQNLSNIADFFTMFYKAIGDAGVFDNLARITGTASKLLSEFDNESGKLPKIAEIFSDAFNIILEPVVNLTEKLADLVKGFLDFAIANPAIAKLATVIFALAGASTIALGWILRLSGSILMLAGSIKLLGGIKAITSTIGTAFSVLGGKLLGLAPLAILLYQAWKNNFLGIQNIVGNTSKKLSLIWDYFKQGYFTDEQYNLAQQLGIIGVIEKIAVLQYYWDYFKRGFAKGWDKAFTAFFDAIEKGLIKIDTVLKNLGIDSGLQKVIDLLGQPFKDLFAVGKEGDFESLGEMFGTIAADAIILLGALKALNAVFKTFKGVAAIFKGLGTVIKFVAKALGLIKFGKFLGDLVAAIQLVLEGNSVLAVLAAWFPKVAAVFSKIGGFFSTLGGWIAQAAGAIWAGIEAIAAALGVSVGWVVAAIVAIIAAIVLLIVFWDEVCYFFTTVVPNAFKTAVDAIGQFFSNLWNSIINSSIVQSVISFVQNVINTVKNAVQAVVNFVTPIIQAIVGFVQAAINVIKSIGNVIAQIFMTIVSVVGGIIGTIISVISGAAQIIWSIIKGIASVIAQIFMGIVSVISNVFGLIAAIARTVFYAILWVVMTVVHGIINFFQMIWNAVSPIFSAIGNFIVSVFNKIVSVAQSVISAICGFFQMIWDKVSPVFSAIGSFIASVFHTIMGVATNVLNSIAGFFNSCADKIRGVWEGISSFFSGVFSAIGGFASGVASTISSAFNSAANAVKSVFDWIDSAISKAKDFVNGIGSKIKSVIPGFATGVESFVGGLAVINERGGELVDLPKGTRVIPHDESIKESLNEGIRLGAKAMSAFNGVNRNGTPVRTSSSGSTQDNRVIFSKGSIVITTVGATQAEMEKAAEFIMGYIERKQKLRSLAVRS